MPGMTRGPGGGPKRRIRTQMRKDGSNTYIVSLNRSVKQLPLNWRELLNEMVRITCASPPRHFRPGLPGQTTLPIERPMVSIPPGSLPTSSVTFVCSRSKAVADLQRRAIDWSLRECDVRFWTVPKPTVRKGPGGECLVATGLMLVDKLVGETRNQFVPGHLKGLDGIDWRHVTQYTVRKGKAEYLGIRTNCGKPCACRTSLPKVWHFGWEMHY